MGRDWVDVYQPHWPNPKQNLNETLDILAKLKNEGKIKYIGLSNHDTNSIRPSLALDENTPQFFQYEFNPIEQNSYYDIQPLLKKVDGVLVGYSPFREGQIFNHNKFKNLKEIASDLNASVSQVLLAWIIRHDNVITIPKTSDSQRLKENVAAYSLDITDEIFQNISNLFKTTISYINTQKIKPVDTENVNNRPIYQTLAEALENRFNLSPSPSEIGNEIIANGAKLNKPIKVKRELESGWFQWVTLDSPASVSIQSGINQPRYPSLKGIMGAKKKEIKVIAASIEDSKQSLDKIFVPQKSKETEVIDTDVDASVDRIIDILRSEIKAF